MNYILISDDTFFSNTIKDIIKKNLEDKDNLIVTNDDYDLNEKDLNNSLILNTVYSERAKSLCLKTEDLNIITLDLTDMFVNDSTIPVISDNDNAINSNSYIFRIPNEYVLYLLNPIRKVLDEYKVKSISIYIYENKEVNPILQNIISSDISTLLDYSELITTNLLNFTEKRFVHLFFEFYRPFNLNTVKEELEEYKPIKISRDLSVNSGFNLWLNMDDGINDKKIIDIIRIVKGHIK